jgi:hypothetical protein
VRILMTGVGRRRLGGNCLVLRLGAIRRVEHLTEPKAADDQNQADR